MKFFFLRTIGAAFLSMLLATMPATTAEPASNKYMALQGVVDLINESNRVIVINDLNLTLDTSWRATRQGQVISRSSVAVGDYVEVYIRPGKGLRQAMRVYRVELRP